MFKMVLLTDISSKLVSIFQDKELFFPQIHYVNNILNMAQLQIACTFFFRNALRKILNMAHLQLLAT